jgi:hypothetical protein
MLITSSVAHPVSKPEWILDAQALPFIQRLSIIKLL